MTRRSATRLTVLLAAGLPAAALTPGVAASTVGGQVYHWIDATQQSGGDDHSWTDPRNWSPAGVLGVGDAADLTPSGDVCAVVAHSVHANVSSHDSGHGPLGGSLRSVPCAESVVSRCKFSRFTCRRGIRRRSSYAGLVCSLLDRRSMMTPS